MSTTRRALGIYAISAMRWAWLVYFLHAAVGYADIYANDQSYGLVIALDDTVNYIFVQQLQYSKQEYTRTQCTTINLQIIINNIIP